ncbi:MAG: hypothetical protein GY846_24635 [Deltaproteobacteria bacterium]|nr:hypothetical protein [Deltaproteobacteria bacterium]
MEVAQKQDIVDVDRTGLVINKSMGADERVDEIGKTMDLNVWGYLPDDENISSYDSLYKRLLDMPDDAPILVPVRNILEIILGNCSRLQTGEHI